MLSYGNCNSHINKKHMKENPRYAGRKTERTAEPVSEQLSDRGIEQKIQIM